MKHHELIRDYFRCFKDRDRTRILELLAPKIDFRSPFGTWSDRDAMIEMIWPQVGAVWAEEIEIFGDEGRYMVRYVHSSPEAPRLAEFIRFDGDDRIAAIEVYLGSGALPQMPAA